MGAWYATLEDIAGAAEVSLSMRARMQVFRVLEESSRAVDAFCSRPEEAFVPVVGTWRYDWPTDNQGGPWRLYLGANPLISATSITSGGVALTADQYILGPDDGPPYTWIEIKHSGSASWSSGDTSQRAIVVAGTRGWRATDRPAGALTAAVATTSGLTIDVDGPAAAVIGVGSVLLVDSERMIVTARSFTDTGLNLAVALAASRADRVVGLDAVADVIEGEQIAIDAERMLVDSVAGVALAVDRATAGTTLSVHAIGASVSASRRLTVQRGALGTTAATHLSGATVSLHYVPAPARRLAVAYTLTALAREGSGFAQTEGSGGETSRTTPGGGVQDAEAACSIALGRRVRHRAV